MGLDMWYFVASKNENALTVATSDESREVGYMRECELAFAFYQELIAQQEEPQSVIQVFEEEVQGLISGGKQFLEENAAASSDDFRSSVEYAIEQSQKALDSFNPDEENLFVVSYW